MFNLTKNLAAQSVHLNYAVLPKKRTDNRLSLNGLHAYKQRSKAFVQKKLLEMVPGELLWPQAMEELFERDYNTIADEIESYRGR